MRVSAAPASALSAVSGQVIAELGIIARPVTEYRSPGAPDARDVVGTLVLGILAGHWRYAHLSALRFDAVAPGLLALSELVSEASVRRGLRRVDQITGRQWLTGHLRQCWWEFLSTPWILDVDTTIKPAPSWPAPVAPASNSVCSATLEWRSRAARSWTTNIKS